MQTKSILKNVALVLCILMQMVANAQNDSKSGYQIGDIVADFSLRNVDGRQVSLASVANSKGYIVIFTCNTCPYAKMYEDRIKELDQKFKPMGYPVVAINPNDPSKSSGDSFEEMKKRAKEKQFEFPYLFDDTQNVAIAFGATRTPEVYLVIKNEDGLQLVYSGAIDDNHKDANAATKKYVEQAIKEVIDGKAVVTDFTKAIGCGIKWKS